MTGSDPTPPDDLPDDLVQLLTESSDQQLRAIVDFAQELLSHRTPTTTDELEAREGEEIVQVDDDDGYKRVVVRRPEASGASEGPFSYRVRWVPEIKGEGGHYEWEYLGQVNEEVLE